MKLSDAIFGFLLLALGATILVVAQAFPKIPGQPVGPALFPGLIATGLCVTGALLVVKGWRMRAEQPWFAFDDWIRSPRHVIALLVSLGSVVFYMVASEALGFLPTATLILVALFTSLRLSVGRSILIAVVAALLIHFAFYKLLRVPLPWGVLKSYTW